MLKKLSALFLSLMICLPIAAAGTAESLEDGINQLAVDMSKQMKAKGIKKIAIDDFTDLNGYKSGLGDFISEELVTSFYTQGADNFEVVERRELARVLKEQELGGSGLLNKTTIAKIGKILGIDAIVTGSIAYLGSSIKVNARMIGVNNAKVFAATSQKMLKDETVEALLGQSARVRSSSPALLDQSANDIQIQSHNTKFENSFLRVTPKQISISKDKRSVVLALDFQNLTSKNLQILVNNITYQTNGRCHSTMKASNTDALIVGNNGLTIEPTTNAVYVSGLSSSFAYNGGYSRYDCLIKKSKYSTIGPLARATVVFRFTLNDKNKESSITDTIFSFSTNKMARFLGNKKYEQFVINIPNIKLSR